jgi:hypothetical protein
MKQWKMLIGSASLAIILMMSVSGCVSNADPSLQKTSTQFAADAAKRNYETTAPRGGDAAARAQYELMQHRVDFANLSQADWADTEIWLNQKYVVFIAKIASMEDKKLDFGMFFDGYGNPFDTNGGQNPVQTIEIFRNGKMYSVKLQME